MVIVDLDGLLNWFSQELKESSVLVTVNDADLFRQVRDVKFIPEMEPWSDDAVEDIKEGNLVSSLWSSVVP